MWNDATLHWRNYNVMFHMLGRHKKNVVLLCDAPKEQFAKKVWHTRQVW